MKTKPIMVSPQMEQIVKDIAARHEMDWNQREARLELTMPGHTERWLLLNLDGERFSVCCYLVEENGILTPDVDMVFEIHAVGWEPIELLYSQEAFANFLQHACAAHLPVYDVEGNLYFDTFTEYWADQLKAQGWIECGQLLAEDASCRRMVGCQSTNHAVCYGELWECAACQKVVCCAEGTDNHPEVCDDCWVKLYVPPLMVPCDCSEEDCFTWLSITPDGILSVEDKDGLRVSIMLPEWLELAIRQAVQARVGAKSTDFCI